MAVSSWRPNVLSALCYFAIGVASAVLSNPVEARTLQTAMRLTALLLGAAVFVAHIRHELLRRHRARSRAAAAAAGGAALGAFLLAVYMVLYNMLARSRPFGQSALVLVVWPLVAAALAYAVGIVIAAVVSRWPGGRRLP